MRCLFVVYCVFFLYVDCLWRVDCCAVFVICLFGLCARMFVLRVCCHPLVVVDCILVLLCLVYGWLFVGIVFVGVLIVFMCPFVCVC